MVVIAEMELDPSEESLYVKHNQNKKNYENMNHEMNY